MNAVPPDPLIGVTLDERYVIRSRIARGGMAVVYLAHDLRLERRVAVKVMHPHLAEDEDFRRRFAQEARSAAGLSHPNLVGIFDQGNDVGHTYLVMEYLPSITLRALLKQQRALTADQAIEIGDAVLSGLAAAHTAGIVHRDLKPENVMLADDGRIKLGDFGLARAVSANTTTGQALLGTIAYLSPELVTRGVADARSDVYAFGIMLYEMLTGEQPFTGEQPMQIAYQHANSEVPSPSRKNPGVSPALDQLVLWMTKRDPDARPRDAAEALEALVRARKGLTVLAPAPATSDTGPHQHTPSTTVLQPLESETLAGGPVDSTDDESHETPVDRAARAASRRRNRGRIWAAAVVVLVAIAGGIGWWFGQGPGSRVSVPVVAGLEMDEAIGVIEKADLVAEVFECTSLDAPEGLADRTEPVAGTPLERGATVQVCKSLGPEILDVPTLVGLSVDDARREIEAAGFTMGEVLEQRFSDESADTVLAALGSDGDGLGDTYPEAETIDLITSAGVLPDVSGASVKKATSTLTGVGLNVDPTLASEEYSDTVPEGKVVAAVYHTDPVQPGDSVGLRVSLGPELFPVPDLSEARNVGDAMDMLRAEGFSPTVTGIEGLDRLSEGLLRRLPFDGLDPESGTMLPLGSTVRILVLD